jgi:predicted nucleotidyltransferase
MISTQAIFDLADAVARTFNPERIVLFGSYAWGVPNEDSDIDVLVVMPYRGPSYNAATRIRLAVDVNFPMDIIVRSPVGMKRRLALNDFFIMDIVEKGVVLYDRHDSGMGQQSRRRLRRRLHSASLAKAEPI